MTQKDSEISDDQLQWAGEKVLLPGHSSLVKIPILGSQKRPCQVVEQSIPGNPLCPFSDG